MSVSLKLVSLNIERSLRLKAVIAFLRQQQADVVCLQEVFERDIETLRKETECTSYIFAPMTRYVRETPPEVMGVAIFSRFPTVAQDILWYGGDPNVVQELDQQDPSTWNNKNLPLAICDVENGGAKCKVVNTHFTWTPDGQVSDAQRRDMKTLLRQLDTLGEFILVGDFNAPRGGEIFAGLASRYRDNVPARYVTSLDQKLHRAAKTRPYEISQRMVDGIFSTPGYIVSNVEMICGVSDHCALVANVSKR